MLTASSSRCVQVSDEADRSDSSRRRDGFEVFRSTDVSSLLLSEQSPAEGSWEDPSLEKLHVFCEESRRLNDWLPEINLPAR